MNDGLKTRCLQSIVQRSALSVASVAARADGLLCARLGGFVRLGGGGAAAREGGAGGAGRARGVGEGVADVLAPEGRVADVVEDGVGDGRDEQRQQERERLAADDDDRDGAALLGAGAGAERERRLGRSEPPAVAGGRYAMRPDD